jgi:hypothetical protein
LKEQGIAPDTMAGHRSAALTPVSSLLDETHFDLVIQTAEAFAAH